MARMKVSAIVRVLQLFTKMSPRERMEALKLLKSTFGRERKK